MLRGLLASAIALLAAAPASAETIGFQLSVFAETIQLANLSDSAEIDALSLTIGDLAFNYDSALAGAPPPAAMLVSPDGVDGGERSNVLALTFAGFAPAQSASVVVGIDDDATGSSAAANGVLFNNGAAPNALLSITFSNGFVFGYTLTDLSAASCDTPGSCAWSAAFEVAEPAAAALFGLGAAALLARRRRRP